MTSAQIKERITKATEKITKKQNTITKKTALIEKKNAQIEKTTDTTEQRYLQSDIKWLQEDIKRLNKEIEETKATIEKYNKQLAGELEKEAIFTKEIPEQFKNLQTELVDRWDSYDKEMRTFYREQYKVMDYREFIKEYGSGAYELRHKSDEDIHKANEKDAKALILDLYNRVKAITGEVTDWSHIRASQGNQGFTVLTGTVIGKEGRASVETILAGGYNIQKLHIRTLVHEI